MNVDELQTKNTERADVSPKWKFWRTRRYVVVGFLFLGTANVWTLRASLSIAIVAMTEKKLITSENNTVIYSKADFDWDSKTQGYILSSFFYGFITTQLIGGWLSSKIGGKKILGVGVAVTGLITILIPVLSRISVYLLITMRIIQGIFEGPGFCCMYAIWSRWIPTAERSTIVTISISGSHIGSLIGMTTSGYLSTALGWSSTFYIFGGFTLVWVVLWWYFIAESPVEDQRISKIELEYVRRSLGNIESKRNLKYQWKKILTSVPVWAIVVAQFTHDWGSFTLLTQLPTFIKDMYNYNLDETGFLSGLPYLGMAVMIQLSGRIADWLIKKQFFSIVNVRKIFTCGAFIMEGVFMILAVYLTLAIETIACVVVAIGFGICCYSGWGVNYLDFAPQHASVIIGVSSTFSALAGICSPILTGYIVTTHAPEEWKIVFCITGGICIFGSIVYGVFASTEVQDWAETEVSTHNNKFCEN